jgi:chromosome segregation ATPase
MRDNEDLSNIPPMVPDRDDVDTHLSNRRSQDQDIVGPSFSAVKVKVSTWPVRIMLTLIVLTLMGSGYGAYYMYGEYRDDLRQADLRISDLERRLSLAGESAEDSAINIIERMDFNFSEIDKLWAARRVINDSIDDISSEVSRLEIVNDGQDEATTNNSQQIAQATQLITVSDTKINTLNTDLSTVTQSVASLNSSLQNLETMRSDMESIRASLTSGDSTVLGLVGRLEYIEGSMESVNAHRLQINESLFRLQESVESIQRDQSPAGSL